MLKRLRNLPFYYVLNFVSQCLALRNILLWKLTSLRTCGMAQVSYSLLVFFCGMFITVNGFNRTGIPSGFWNFMEPYSRINHVSGVTVLSIVILLLSNLASNVPTGRLSFSLLLSSATRTVHWTAWLNQTWLLTQNLISKSNESLMKRIKWSTTVTSWWYIGDSALAGGSGGQVSRCSVAQVRGEIMAVARVREHRRRQPLAVGLGRQPDSMRAGAAVGAPQVHSLLLGTHCLWTAVDARRHRRRPPLDQGLAHRRRML